MEKVELDDFLTDGVLKEKDFRSKIKLINWNTYKDKKVLILGAGGVVSSAKPTTIRVSFAMLFKSGRLSKLVNERAALAKRAGSAFARRSFRIATNFGLSLMKFSGNIRFIAASRTEDIPFSIAF